MPGRRGLDRETVVRTAAELLDAADGREVTMGEIAARLGVRTPSLYNHIGGQEELQRALALLGVRELGARIGRAAIGRAGVAAVLAIAEAYRAFARERPGLYRATLRAPDPGDAALAAAAEEILTILRLVLESCGVSGREEQVHAMRGLRSLLHGFTSLELAGGFGLPEDLDESFRWALRAFMRGLGCEDA